MLEIVCNEGGMVNMEENAHNSYILNSNLKNLGL